MTAPGAVSHPTDGVVEQALARAGVYRLLGRTFGYPTPEVVREVGELAARIAQAPGTEPVLVEGLTRLAEAARAVEPMALAGEYVLLFDRQVPCSPYEGAYEPMAPMAAGKSAQLADVAGFYAAFGMTPAAGQPDVEDHVAVELEFMSVLALREAYALADGSREGQEVVRAAQVTFLTDHLGRWADIFARGVASMTPLPYYTAAADLLATWLPHEIAALGATPTRPAGPPAPGPLEADSLTCPMAETPPAEAPAHPGSSTEEA
jgi:TorA maturation chaperone TorD